MATGTTPCKARNTAFELHAKLLQIDPTFPNDNNWRLTFEREDGVVGFAVE